MDGDGRPLPRCESYQTQSFFFDLLPDRAGVVSSKKKKRLSLWLGN